MRSTTERISLALSFSRSFSCWEVLRNAAARLEPAATTLSFAAGSFGDTAHAENAWKSRFMVDGIESPLESGKVCSRRVSESASEVPAIPCCSSARLSRASVGVSQQDHQRGVAVFVGAGHRVGHVLDGRIVLRLRLFRFIGGAPAAGSHPESPANDDDEAVAGHHGRRVEQQVAIGSAEAVQLGKPVTALPDALLFQGPEPLGCRRAPG